MYPLTEERNADFKYVDLQIVQFPCAINGVMGTPVYSREKLFEIWRIPMKT